MRSMVKRMIPFIAALLLLMVCGTFSKEETARPPEEDYHKALYTKISTGSGNPDDIPTD